MIDPSPAETTVTPRVLPLLVVLSALAALAGDWPAWRGPDGTGVSAETGLPTRWSATKNVRWRVPLEGAGVSAPVVSGGRLFLTSSDGRQNDRLHLLCYRCADGELLWHSRFFGSAVSEGQFAPGGMAVPTPAADGERVHALFGTGDLVCVDFEGRPVWVRSLAQEYGSFRNRWGMAASPLLVGGLLVVQVDHWGESYLLGVDAATGANRWRTRRNASVNWTSPVAARVGGQTQIIAAGTHTLEGYDAADGRRLWSVEGLQMQCIPSPVVQGERVYAVSGRDHYTMAVRLDGRSGAEVLWRVRSGGAYVPSPVCVGEFYYYVEDNGWGNCLRAATGERVWRERLSGKYSASPVAADGKMYFSNDAGVVTVVRAGPEFKVLAKNDVGEALVASPALSGGRLFLRGDKHLWCIEEK
jgi:outer membrane protein assembly factor BamB